MVKKARKVDRPWINLQEHSKSILRCKDTELIVDKIFRGNSILSTTTLEIDGSIYWLPLPDQPHSKLSIKRVVNKALRIHNSADITMEIRYTTPTLVFGMSVVRRDHKRTYISFHSKDPETIVILIRSKIYPLNPADEIELQLFSGGAPWGKEYALPYKDHLEWNQTLHTSAGMARINRHLKDCLDLHKSFYSLSETD